MQNEFKILEERIEHLKEVYRHDKEAIQKALDLQASEYERRMETLNHEAARVLDVQTRSVNQEIFDELKKNTEQKLSKLENWQSTENGKKAVYAIILIVVMFVINYFKVNTIESNKAQLEVLEIRIKVLEDLRKK